MESMQFGDILRQARERNGEDIMSVARRIRIRPDILERIEASDLDNMPPRGYSRNMINAYARYLGLNQTEIVKMYLDASYNQQVTRARSSARSTGFDMSTPRDRRGRRESVSMFDDDPLGSGSTGRSNYSTRASASRTRGNTQFNDDLFEDIQPLPKGTRSRSVQQALDSRSAYGTRRSRQGVEQVESLNAYGQGLSSRGLSRDPYETQASASRRQSVRRNEASETRRMAPLGEPAEYMRQNRRSRRDSYEDSATSLYTPQRDYGRGIGGNWDLRSILPFIIAGVVILLLVIIIALMVSGIGKTETASNESGTSAMNITGLPETAGSESSDEDYQTSAATTASITELPPTMTIMSYEVESGYSAYVEIYVNDSCVEAGTFTGPYENTFEVTGTFEFVSSPFEGVTLWQDGEEVELKANDYGIAVVDVNFQDVLDKWNEEHPKTEEKEESSGE